MLLKVKDIMNTELDSLKPFLYYPHDSKLNEDLIAYLERKKIKRLKIPAIDNLNKFLGFVDTRSLSKDVKFEKIQVLNLEDDISNFKEKISEDYLNENYYIYVLDNEEKLVGFIPSEIGRFLVNDIAFYMFVTAINYIHDGVVIVDKNSKIIYVNEAYSKILNVDKHKILNKFISEIEPGALILEALKEHKPKVNKVVQVKSVGKKVVVNINPINIGNEFLGAISTFKDVTEVSLLNQELRNVRKLSEDFYNGAAKKQQSLPKEFDSIIGKNERFIQCLKLASIVAPTEAAILVEGESGVGKEVIVSGIFRVSNRAKKPFVEINCSAIPESLFESELFGYSEGAFTGAQKGGKLGKFELADGGTIFLDEIGDMPLLMQAKLLRVLQSGEIQKVGANNIKKVDVRVIAATNRDLKSMVKEGSFREDLYFRLNTFNIIIPPLKERIDDVELLTEYFLNLYCSKYNKKLEVSEEAIEVLKKYNWPGNVRELQSCIEYSVVICQHDVIEVDNLPENIKSFSENEAPYNHEDNERLKDKIYDVEKIGIENSLKEFHGNRTKAMEKLGMSRRTFYRKLKMYNINPDDYK